MNSKTAAVNRALGIVPVFTPGSDADATPVVPGFDGGARRDQPAPPVSHEETLLALLATRRADAGGGF